MIRRFLFTFSTQTQHEKLCQRHNETLFSFDLFIFLAIKRKNNFFHFFYFDCFFPLIHFFANNNNKKQNHVINFQLFQFLYNI